MRLTSGIVAVLLMSCVTVGAQEFERALVPIAITDRTLPGAFGSEWKTIFGIHNGSSGPILLGYPLEACTHYSPCVNGDLVEGGETSFRSGEEYPFYLDTTAPGTLITFPRTSSSFLSFQLRIQDVSRQSLTWGTEIPVVREHEFRTGILQLLNVPLDDRFRQMLRVYGLEKETGEVALRFYSIDDGSLVYQTTVAMRATAPPNSSPYLSPDYAQVGTFLDAFPALSGTRAVRVELEGSKPIWAFVSVTNNETQHVTTITPQ